MRKDRYQSLNELSELKWNSIKGKNQFTGIPEYDRKLSDLENYPHLFVLGCLMDRQIKAERAWKIPIDFAEQLLNGDYDFRAFINYFKSPGAERQLSDFFKERHRLINVMPDLFKKTIFRIYQDYQGDASQIWIGEIGSAELVYRFLQFDGVGQKIANMAAMILVRDFNIQLSNYHYIDIAIDAHVSRVMGRLGLVAEGSDPSMKIAKIRAINPKFPGKLDALLFYTGREFCGANSPKCVNGCTLRGLCAYEAAH